MTIIKKLEMKGFKSFANYTEMIFCNKFNCILGPNGSGKSNVLDALCFVLGKSSAKGLRAEKTSNLIYNGGKNKQPAKEGVVSITFDNEKKIFGKDFDELKITRIVKQTGQSIYKINDVKSTRQEILDILSKAKIDPNGYNIILQGDINSMIEMSSSERYKIIEQISGISIYEDKKNKTIRELDRIEAKLNEAEIILAERKTYLKELKKERDQAAKFKDLNEKIQRNKKTILVNKLAINYSELKKNEDLIKKNNEKLTKLQEKSVDKSKEIIMLKKDIEKINKEVESKGEKEQVIIHKEVEQLKIDLALKKQRLETLNQEIKKLSERKEELKKTNKELFNKIKFIEEDKKDSEIAIKKRESQIKDLKKKIFEFKNKNNMEDVVVLDKQIEEIDKKAENIQEQLVKLREQQQNMFREKDRLEIRLEQADEQIEKIFELEKANKEALEELKNKKSQFATTTKDLSKALNEDSSYLSQLRTAREKLLSRKDELRKLELRNNTIQEGIAGGLAVQKILNQKKNISGIYGTVAELGSVKKEFSMALEISAGSRLKSIVVENDQVAAKCINFLKSNRLGVATFLPINKIKSPTLIEAPKGVIGRAVDLIDYDKKFSKIFEYVFGNTMVVKDIDTGRKIGVGKVRMVTLTGDLIESSGAMQGGFRNKKQRIGFQEKEVSEKIKRLKKEVDDIESVVNTLELKRKDNEDLINRLRELKANLEVDIIKIEKTLHIDSKDLDMNKEEKKRVEKELLESEKELDDIILNINNKNRELSVLKTKKQQLRDQMSNMRSPAVLAQLNTFEEKMIELNNEIINFKTKLNTNQSEIKNILGPEYEKITQILKQHDKEKKIFLNEQSDIKIEIKDIESNLKIKESAMKKFMIQFKGLFNKRSKLNDKIQKLELDIKNIGVDIKITEQKNNGINLMIARLKAEIAGFEEENKQYGEVEPYKNKPKDDILLEIKQFERMMNDFGAVNMKALDIYDAVEKEYKKLITKKDKLTGEREDVLVMINEIDNKKQSLFMKTFEVVNNNFEQIFSMLNTKGKAFLELENDSYGSGLNIKVRLTGKKYLDIRSLSGGEKTMTALAFLFAIQEYEPASFYVLDEVDAALDKNNSGKLAKLVRAYCRNAQYLIISHNDGIIAEADNLYGTSMNEHGISKIISLKI